MRQLRDDEAKLYNRIRFLKDLIAEEKLQPSACPLLESELNSIRVLASKLMGDVIALQTLIKE